MIEFTTLAAIFIENWEVILFFFLVAILYASVGFGGGSSYLAILVALTTIGYIEVRALALLCNIVVVFGGTYFYTKHGYYNWKKVIPLIIASVPMSFLGGYLKIGQAFFFILLGATLIIAAILMWMSKYFLSRVKNLHNNRSKNFMDGVFGGVIGFLAGMVGIGGGVFLAPLLHLTNWDTPKRIAATTSFFILVNSIAGLIGQTQNPDFYFDINLALLLMSTVFLGGQIGSRLSVTKISPIILKRITALLIALVGFRILIKYLN